jgi:hypothetical protein
MRLHVHIYDQDKRTEDNLVEEIDLDLIDEYREYYQFGFERGDEWIEIRVPK